MALDGIYLHCLRGELLEKLTENHSETVKYAKIEKIYQPTKDTVIVSFRGKGVAEKLLICARADSPRVHITEKTYENPDSPPMFCMLMRKHLTGARLLNIRQIGLDRTLYFEFSSFNELGDSTVITLAVEIMGRHSNIILINGENKVLDSIKRVPLEKSSVRIVLPGVMYENPPVQADKISLTDKSASDYLAEIMRSFSDRDVYFSKALLEKSQGFSPLVCREIAYRACGGDKPLSATDENEISAATACLGEIHDRLMQKLNAAPCIIYREEKPFEFCFMPIFQYGDTHLKNCASLSSLLDEFFSDRDSLTKTKQYADDILQVISLSKERVLRKLQNQKLDLEKCENSEHLRVYGDVIYANLYQITSGMTSIDLQNFYSENGDIISIKLDPLLDGNQNAQKYFKKYKKAQSAKEHLTVQIQKGEDEFLYLESLEDAVSRANSFAEIAEIRAELYGGGYIKKQSKKNKVVKPLGPIEFISSDGYTIFVGRNNLQNDQLTLKKAGNNDLWFHTKNIPGSHVVVVSNNTDVPKSTIFEAATLAALHSKAGTSSNVPVDYTQIRNVKKPNGAKPGMVIYEKNNTAFVTPDSELADKLKK